MKKNACRRLPALALWLPLTAAAQANPVDPAAPAPSLRYQSAFADYKPWQEAEPGDWRALNDALRRAPAGHAGHGAASAPAPSPAASQGAPAQPSHGGHQGHGGRP